MEEDSFHFCEVLLDLQNFYNDKNLSKIYITRQKENFISEEWFIHPSKLYNVHFFQIAAQYRK